LCAEAIRLSRLLAELMPDEPEALGLLSLTLLQDSRRAARIDRAGDLVTLEEQDRGLWDAEEIEEACRFLDRAVRLRRSGPYQLQAAVAATHAQAPTAVDTDWREIVILYDRLSEMAPTPVVLLNRAVAVAMVEGPAAGLALVDDLDRGGALAGYYLLPATRADLLRRLGRDGAAAVAYRSAVELVPTDAERRFLRRRLSEVSRQHPD
jgi:RNA polymerase sigma-70 factor (ECF subfamily)